MLLRESHKKGLELLWTQTRNETKSKKKSLKANKDGIMREKMKFL